MHSEIRTFQSYQHFTYVQQIVPFYSSGMGTMPNFTWSLHDWNETNERPMLTKDTMHEGLTGETL